MGLLDGTRNVVAALSPEDQRYMLEWGKEQQRRALVDPLNHGFKPHQSQLKVHRSLSKESLFVAANRIGKTTTGMREALWRATGTHPYKHTRPHTQIWCGFPDYPFFLRTTLPMFRKWAPRDSLIEYNKSEKWASFRRPDGGVCTIFFVSYDSGRDKWQGAGVDFIWLDEECPQEIYEEAIARLIDSGGEMLLTQTPVSGLGWAYDTIFLPAQTGSRDTEVIEGALAEYRDECRHCGHGHEEHRRDGRCEDEDCQCRGYEAAYELFVGPVLVPHLTHEQVLRFARSIKDPDMRLIRIFGRFRARAGGVYKMFMPEVHVVPEFKVPSYWEVWGGIDPGFHGFAVVLLAQDPMGRIYVIYEYFSQHETAGTRARELWGEIQTRVHVEEDDYVAFYVDTEDPQTVLELNTWAQENGCRMAFASLKQGLKARKAGIQRIQEQLSPDRRRATPSYVRRDRPAAGEPLMYFFDTLGSSWLEGEEAVQDSRLVWELTRYLWKRKTKEGGSRHEDADERSAGGAHMLAALRYATMARVGAPEPPEAEADPRMDDISREVWDHMRERDAELQEQAGWSQQSGTW
jgi:phage terminase large subunit-like protein